MIAFFIVGCNFLGRSISISAKMESSAVKESSPSKRPLGDDNVKIEMGEAKKMKFEVEAEGKNMKFEAEVRKDSLINGGGEEKTVGSECDGSIIKNENVAEDDKNDNDKEANEAKVKILGDSSSNPRDSNFTSEIFKIEIHGLPRHTGYGQLKKFLLKLGLESKKVSPV